MYEGFLLSLHVLSPNRYSSSLVRVARRLLYRRRLPYYSIVAGVLALLDLLGATHSDAMFYLLDLHVASTIGRSGTAVVYYVYAVPY